MGSEETYEAIMSVVGKHFRMPADYARIRSKKGSYLLARQIAAYFLKIHTSFSLVEIGRRIDRKHSTIISNLKKMEGYIVTDINIRRHVNAIRLRLYEIGVGGVGMDTIAAKLDIDLSLCYSVETDKGKHLVFTGMTKSEVVNHLKKLQMPLASIRQHRDANIVIIKTDNSDGKEEQGKVAQQQD